MLSIIKYIMFCHHGYVRRILDAQRQTRQGCRSSYEQEHAANPGARDLVMARGGCGSSPIQPPYIDRRSIFWSERSPWILHRSTQGGHDYDGAAGPSLTPLRESRTRESCWRVLMPRTPM